MADAALAGACRCSSFSALSVESVKSREIVLASLRNSSFPHPSLSFQECVPRSLKIVYPHSVTRQRQSSVKVNAVVGYPSSMTWWKKGNQPNMRDIYSGDDFVDALTKAGDKLVLVDFYSTGCRSCKAMHPKVCQLAAENPDIEVLKVDFYDNNALCRSLNVNILPFFHVHRGSEGRVDAFSCSLLKVKKLRDAVAKYKSCRLQTPAPTVARQNSRLVSPTRTLVAAGSTV